ncbi:MULTISPECIES: YCF48-related protein [unclassified Pseudidiomarina]|uniref:sialidase family protein n=1 Tax=Pseudidiomarina salilacus TaxID=3384452 RepID=UPI003985544F
MAKGMQKLFSLLAGLAPWLIVAGLAYAAAFIKPETELRPLPQPLLEARDVFFDVVATPDDILVYVGRNGTFLTRNADREWQRGQFAEEHNLQAIAQHTNGTIAAVGNQGAFYVYDGELSLSALAEPNNWQFQALPVSEFAGKLLGITASADGFWVVGEMGTIFHLQQSAKGQPFNVQAKELEQDVNLSDVAVAANGSIWIAGEFGTLLSSTDNGANWQSQELTDVTLQSIAIDAEHMLVVGNSGYMAASYDQGASWEQLDSPTDAHLYSAALSEQGWLVAGANGTLLWRNDNNGWQALEGNNSTFNFVSNSAQTTRQTFVFTGSHLTSLDFSRTPLQFEAVTPTAKAGAL